MPSEKKVSENGDRKMASEMLSENGEQKWGAKVLGEKGENGERKRRAKTVSENGERIWREKKRVASLLERTTFRTSKGSMGPDQSPAGAPVAAAPPPTPSPYPTRVSTEGCASDAAVAAAGYCSKRANGAVLAMTTAAKGKMVVR